MVDLGIVGVGSMGSKHARIANSLKDCRLAVISDLDKEKGAEIAKKEGAEFSIDYKEMFDKVDCAVIAVPTKFHAQVACDFIGAGIPVLIEKPIANTLQDAEKIVEMANVSKLPVMVGQIERFNPLVKELKNIIGNEEIIQIEARRYGPPLDRDTGIDVVLDLMIHDIDIVRFLTGSEPSDILSIGGKTDHYENYAMAMLNMGGTLCALSSNLITQSKLRTIDITTESKFVRGDYIEQNAEIYRKSLPSFVLEEGEMKYKQQYILEKVDVYKQEPLRLELQHFVECVRSNKTPFVTVHDGLANLKIALEIVNKMKRFRVV